MGGCRGLGRREGSSPRPGAGGDKVDPQEGPMWAGGCRWIPVDPLVEHGLREAMSQHWRIASHAPARRPVRRLRDLASYATPFQAHISGVGIRVDIFGEADRLGCGRRSLRCRPRGRDAEITPGDRPEWAEGCLALTRPPDRPGITRLVAAAEPLGAAQRNPGYDDPSSTPLAGGAYASPRFPGQRHDELGRVFPDPPSLHPGYAS